MHMIVVTELSSCLRVQFLAGASTGAVVVCPHSLPGMVALVVVAELGAQQAAHLLLILTPLLAA